MKLIFFLLLILQISEANAQVIGDTLYKGNHVNQVVFIDTSHSRFHGLVFKNLLTNLQEFGIRNADTYLQGDGNASFDRQWITVKKFRRKYFAYYPSEPFYNTFIYVSDSNLIMNDFNEGFVSYSIVKEKSDIREIRLKLNGNEGIQHFISIKQKSNGMCKVKSSLFNSGKLYFVSRANFYNLPIIVNYCPTNRCPEFSFKEYL